MVITFCLGSVIEYRPQNGNSICMISNALFTKKRSIKGMDYVKVLFEWFSQFFKVINDIRNNRY